MAKHRFAIELLALIARGLRGKGVPGMKRLLCTLLAGLTLLALSGCRSAFERDYYYETPYAGDIGIRTDKATEIRNYSMLKTALTNMITNHTEKGEFRFSSYNGNISEDLAAACFEIKSEHPLGAYAVETLSYDTSYVVSYYMANIYIGYKRTAEELKSIVYTSKEADFDANVLRALDEYLPGLVIRCFAPGIDEQSIHDLVKRHYFDDPLTLIAQPEAEVTSYPADGANCIYDIRFRYGLPQQNSIVMAATLGEKLHAAAEAMTETQQPQLALESARFLVESCAGGDPERIYADTAYGALVNANADSKGFALAYKALCTALGIDCIVVEGSFGGIVTQTHYWNIVTLDGNCYHVDLSAMAEDPASAFLLSDEALWGRYIWDTEAYPDCGGPLRYAEVAGIPEDSDTQETGEEAPDRPAAEESQPTHDAQETAQPQETPTPETPEETPPAEHDGAEKDETGEGEKTP